ICGTMATRNKERHVSEWLREADKGLAD
ncbi:hypothetical protein EVA_20011, partial [gut metagenome]